jgi:serine/threonine protein phosphatase PrpC
MSRTLHFSSFAWRSELGLHREGNEDSGLVSKNLIAVADGMGGYAGGEVASSAAIKTINELLPVLSNPELDAQSRDDIYSNAVKEIDSAIRAIADEKPELDGMGTTLTSIALFDNQVHLLHVGDSRAYRIRGKTITRLSHDHTVVQELIDQGRITPDEASDHPQRSFLTQALMGKMNIEAPIQSFPAELGDIYLVCSDGLTVVVDEGKVAAAFSEDLQAAVNSLVDLTYKKDAPDNVTVIAARIGDVPGELSTISIGATK